MITSWRAYQGRTQSSPSSVDPVETQGKDYSDLFPRRLSTEELSIEDLEKSRSSHMNGFVTKDKDEGCNNEEKSKGYRKSSIV